MAGLRELQWLVIGGGLAMMLPNQGGAMLGTLRLGEMISIGQVVSKW